MKAPLLDQYDWIILGDHPAGLWAALQLIDSGLKVLVVPKLAAHSDENEIHLQESNWCPEWVPGELRQNKIQVLTPEKRFSIGRTLEDFNLEWKRTFGEVCKPELNNAQLKSFVNGLSFVYRGHDLNPVLPDDWKRILLKVGEQRAAIGGLESLKDALKAMIEKSGSRVLESHLCQQIFVEPKGFKGVQLQGISNIITAPAALLCVNWSWAQTYFSTESSLKSDPQGWWFTLQFTLPSEMVPVGATPKMVYAEAESPVIEIELVDVNPKTKDETWMARTLLPFQSYTLNRDFQRKAAQRLFVVLQNIFPFLEYSASSITPDIRDPEKVEEFDLVQLYSFRDLEHIPPALLAYGGKGIGHNSPFSGLYISYGESYPRFGQFGAYHAAALAITEWAKKMQKPLSMQTLDVFKKAIVA